MNLLQRLLGKKQESPSEQVVAITFSLSEEIGTESEREYVKKVCDRLDGALQEAGAGDCDGHGFGEYRGEIFLYGSDARMMYQVARPILEGLKFRPVHIVLRFGSGLDPKAPEEFLTIA